MELGNHRVVSGDNLSKLATRYGTSVERLKQLNSFITDVNHIEVGWNLSVPAQSGGISAAAPSSPTAKTSGNTPVALPADTPVGSGDDQSFCEDDQPACSKQFDDIVYVTGQRKFWLLPKRVTEQFGEAAATLRQNTIDTDKATRMSRIAESGLMDYFITPGPDAFLDATDDDDGERRRYLAAKEALAEEEQVQEEANNRWYEARSRGDSMATMQAERDIFNSKERAKPYQEAIKQLEALSYQRAESMGYIRENGVLYTPRMLQARDVVDVYLTERDKALAHGYTMFEPGNREIDSIWEHLRYYKRLHQQLVESGEIDYRALRGARLNILTLEDLIDPYISAIIELAEYGIAVPEFALSPDDLYQGTEDFQAYFHMLRNRQLLERRIEERYAQWTSATAGNAAPPGVLFADLQARWHQLNDQAEGIKANAEMRVRDQVPSRLFLWEPESYRPQPVERLVRATIPLREFTQASDDKGLQHLSLRDLAKLGADELGKALNEIRELPKPVGSRSDKDEIFSDWLVQQGAHALEDQGRWFDQDGIFVPHLFFNALAADGFEVLSLQSEEARNSWGETLKVMIYEDRQFRKMMLFDNSLQAQFVRCLLPPGTSLHLSANLDGPEWHKGSGALSASASLEVVAWRGEVTLLEFTIPQRIQAQAFELDYRAYDGSIRKFNFGKLSLSFSAKAWGFAGASLMLSRDFMLDQTTNYTSLVGVETAKRSGELAEYDLFVGAQAGCTISGQLDWLPPPGTLPPAPVPNRTCVDEWQTLAKLDAEIVAALGAGRSGSLYLQLRNGRFHLSIKGSLVWGAGFKGYANFEVGYKSVIALLELLRLELAANRNQTPDWIDSEAYDFANRLCLFGAVGMDVPFLYVRGYAVVKGLYDWLTEGGRGGAIAYTLMRHEEQDTLRSWIQGLQPAALGPLLMALSSQPVGFSIGEGDDKDSVNTVRAHLYQQQAIKRCLEWIHQEDNAVQQFEDAVILMNRDGIRPENAGQTYCENRQRLDSFMETPVLADVELRSDEMRAEYVQLARALGQRLDGYCEKSIEYSARGVMSGHETKVHYRGPQIG